jgi:predicted CopG family antitoxin
MAESANKRIPVTDEIWQTLSNLKRPGQTYDNLLAEMIEIKQERDFLAHIEEIEKTAQFVSLSDAAKELGITKVKKESFNRR